MTIHTKTNNNTIDMETLITVIFVIVDDWYQEQGVKLLAGKQGCKAVFSDGSYVFRKGGNSAHCDSDLKLLER